MLTLLDYTHKTRNLGHTDLNDADASDFRVISLDNKDLPDWCNGKKRLRTQLNFWDVESIIGNTLEVAVAKCITLLYYSANRGSPSVVTKWAKIALIHRSMFKGIPEVVLLLLWKCISPEHLSKRITLIFQPKFVFPKHISPRHVEVRIVFSAVDDGVFCISIVGHRLLFELSGEPSMPAFETIVRLLLIANYLIVV